MAKVNFQTPISGKDLKLPDLPPEVPTSDSQPTITHTKSKRGGDSILKRSFDLFRKLSTHKSRDHVGMKLDKKIGTSQFEASSTVHIKTTVHKNVSFSKSHPKNEPAVRNENPHVTENKVRTRDELNLMYLTNGLRKISKGKDANERSKLETALHELLGDRGGELDKKILVELKTVADQLYLMPEVKDASMALREKIDTALSKKTEAASQHLVKAEKIAMPALDGSMLSAKAEKLRDPQSKLPAPATTLEDLMLAIGNSKDIDDIAAAFEPMEVSSQKNPNQTNSAAPLSADDELESALKDLNEELKRT